jgi:hypothetical protein
MLQVVVVTAKGLQGCRERVMCCKEMVGRVGARAVALVPALQELQKSLSVSLQGVEMATVQSFSFTFMLLAKVHQQHWVLGGSQCAALWGVPIRVGGLRADVTASRCM